MTKANTPKPKKAAKPAGRQVDKNQLLNNPASQKAAAIFGNLKKKTGIDNKKVDEWQKKWLTLPKNRTKYENLKDAPMVAIEESVALTNDIIDFIQGEEGGQSEVFKKVKSVGEEIKKDPKAFFKKTWQESEILATGLFKKAKGLFGQAKELAGKTQNVAKTVKNVTKKGKK